MRTHVLSLKTDEIKMNGFQKLKDDTEKIIEKDSTASSLSTESDESKPDFHSLNDRLAYILNTNKFHVTIVCLILIDCLLVISELLLDLSMFTLSLHEFAPHVLHYASIAILCLFLVEIITRVAVFRLCFFKHKLEILDALVVVVTFVLSIVYIDTEGLESGIGLLIVLRLWRVTRILHGVISVVKKQANAKVHHEKCLRLATEQELKKYREYCGTQEAEIEALRQLLRKHGIRSVFSSEIPKLASTINVVAEVNQVDDTLYKDLTDRVQNLPSSY